MSREKVLAIVTEVGTRTSHTAILARALEIPAVVGVQDILSYVGSSEQLIVDGLSGRVVLAPTQEMIFEAMARAARHSAVTRGLRELRDKPAVTRCGVPIRLQANIELPGEANLVMLQGAEGIGLYRTEFMVVDPGEPPSEQEQYETYRSVLEAVAPLPVTLRTFDLGGDKFTSLFPASVDAYDRDRIKKHEFTRQPGARAACRSARTRPPRDVRPATQGHASGLGARQSAYSRAHGGDAERAAGGPETARDGA